MFIFCLTLLAFSIFNWHLDLYPMVQHFSQPLHQFCMQMVPAEQVHHDLSQALLCGHELPISFQKQLILDSGLYHVLVVSGAHLVFFAQLLERLPRKVTWLTLPILALYTGMCQAAPPVTRAWIGLLIQTLQRRFHLGWSPALRSIITSTICLVFFANWIHSISFWMSSCAGLALGLCRGKSSALSALVVMCLMIPLLFSAMGFQPLPWILNFTLAEFLGALMLPMVAMSCLLPIHALVDGLWDVQLSLLKNFSSLLTEQRLPLVQFPPHLYIWSLNAAWLVFSCIRRWNWR